MLESQSDLARMESLFITQRQYTGSAHLRKRAGKENLRPIVISIQFHLIAGLFMFDVHREALLSLGSALTKTRSTPLEAESADTLMRPLVDVLKS